MATYGTDLILLAAGSDGSGGTWGEFTDWDSGGTPDSETENFIQGAASYSQTFGNATTGKSIAFDATADIASSIPTGDVVMGWMFMGAATNMYGYATGGHSFGIGSDLDNFDIWYISGDDRAPNPYGGWWNIAIDPRHTPDAYDVGAGTGNGGAWRYFGSIIGGDTLGIRVKIAKGNPHAVDGLLMGRGEIYCTGTGATFTLMAADNDLVANRWGLLQDTGGDSFLWKGLMSLGQSGTSATFAASNQNIKIDDTAKTYPAFNKIEIRNASTSVTWDNISFSAAGTYSPGQFEMVENAATVDLTGCTFNNMNTFIFLSNAVLTGCTWNGCGQITHGGADFSVCNFAGYEGTADTAYMTYDIVTDPTPNIDNCSFTKGIASTHAIEFDATNTPTTITLTGIDFTGYNAANGNTDSTLYFPSTTKSYIVNLVGCTGDISYKVGVGGSVTFVSDPVTLKFTVKDGFDGSLLSGALVFAWVTSGVNFPYQASVVITGSGTTATVTHTDHGLSTNDYIMIEGVNENAYNGSYQITVNSTSEYEYTTNETIPSSPATGTPISTYVMINGTTDGIGEISASWSLSSDQPFGYRVRKSTSEPFFIGASSNNTILTTGDKDIGVQLTRDQ